MLGAWSAQKQALDLMNRELSARDWLVGSAATIADVALLAYTRLAPEGGFDLSSHTHLKKWIARCEQQFAIN